MVHVGISIFLTENEIALRESNRQCKRMQEDARAIPPSHPSVVIVVVRRASPLVP